jgi:hypothetical protein
MGSDRVEQPRDVAGRVPKMRADTHATSTPAKHDATLVGMSDKRLVSVGCTERECQNL